MFVATADSMSSPVPAATKCKTVVRGCVALTLVALATHRIHAHVSNSSSGVSEREHLLTSELSTAVRRLQNESSFSTEVQEISHTVCRGVSSAFPLQGVRYIPHLVGEPYPPPDSAPSGYYSDSFSGLHERDLPLIGGNVGADTLSLRPWPTDENRDGFFDKMRQAGVCKVVPTFHVAKFYADMLKSGSSEPKADPGSPFAVDFGRFGASVTSDSLGGIKMAAWTVDLSLDLSKLLPKVGKTCATSKVTQDRTFQMYIKLLNAIWSWIHPQEAPYSVAPALSAAPFLLPLDMSRVAWTEPLFHQKLNLFVECMGNGAWSKLFSGEAGVRTRWLFSYGLPLREEVTYHFFYQLRNVSKTLTERAVVMVGTQALERGHDNPINRANLIEDFNVSNDRYQSPYNAYQKVQEETNMLDGFIYDEWMDDWDRGVRGPFFIASQSLHKMSDPCDSGGRFSHDIKGCSRTVGNSGRLYPEFFGLVGSSSQVLQHCIYGRFNESLFDEASTTPGEITLLCASMMPSFTWISLAFLVLLSVFSIQGLRTCAKWCKQGFCRGQQAERSSAPEVSEEPKEKRAAYVKVQPRNTRLHGDHSIELVSTQFRSDEEAGWWLCAHVTSQIATLEKQVNAEVEATRALKSRAVHCPPVGAKTKEDYADVDLEESMSSESSEQRDDLTVAVQVIHRRTLEGFAAWCAYVSGGPPGCRGRTVDPQELRMYVRAIEDNVERPAALLFVEMLVLRTMESVGEQMLQCPERISYLLYHIFQEAGGLEDVGPTTFSIDLDKLHDGLHQMNMHSDPYTKRKMPNGKWEFGLNFDDINDCGIQCRDGVAKTFKEPSSIMVIVDFFLCYRVAIMLKLYCLAVSGYIYLGSQRGDDISTAYNGSFFAPKWLRINYIQYVAIIDAVLWTLTESSLIVYTVWQRSPSLCWKSPGIPGIVWALEHFLNLSVSMLGGLCVYWGASFVRKPWECAQSDLGHCADSRAEDLLATLHFAGIYWVCRVVIFVFMNGKRVPIFIYGTPDRKVRKDSGRGFCANWTQNLRVNFAWLCMLGLCVIIEVGLLLPTMKGLDWSTTCGMDVFGDVSGMPLQRGVCSEADHVLAFGCVTCLASTSAGWILVFLGSFVDIYFVFYLASAVVGSYMGHRRNLNDLKNPSLPIDLRQHQGREAILFEKTFGPGWQQIWRLMVRNLCQESMISTKHAAALVQAAGISMDGEVPDGTKAAQKPIHLTRFPALAAERLAFFFQSLKWIESYSAGRNMGFEPETDALTAAHFDPGTIPSLSQIIPVYGETVLPSLEFLRAGADLEDARNGSPDGQPGLGDLTLPPQGDGVNTNLAFMISQFPDEWVFLAKRLHSEGFIENAESSSLYWAFMKDKLRGQGMEEVRLWAAMRMQTVAKTVIGALQYGRALASLPKIKEHYAQFPEKRLPEDHVEVILAHQTYGHQTEGNEANDESVRLLMEKYADDPLYLVFDLKKGSHPELWRMVEMEMAARGTYFAGIFEQASVKCQWDKARRGLRVVDVLPRKFQLRLGVGEFKTQGKAGNQLNGLRFASGHYVQALDCNMGTFIGEAFKMPYVLRMFMPLGKEDRSAPMCRYLGFREHIYTGREGTVGQCLAAAEWTFGTITQRFLSGMGTRMHYGHPDFLDGFWARNRGGMSKSSAVVNLSEDLFAGYNVRMREEASPHIDALEFEKGRETTFNASTNFFAKIAGGSVAVVRSRDNHLLCDRVGILHSLSFYFASVSFYVSNLLVDYSIYVYVGLFILFELAGFGPGELAALGSTFHTEWIISMGLITLVPQFCEMVLEYGAVHSIRKVLMGLFSSTCFFIFQNKSIAASMKEGVMTGMARYLSTGRPPANQHQTWKDCYVMYWKSHYQPALTLISGYTIYTALAAQSVGKGKLPMVLVVISFLSWLFTPIIFSPFPRWSLLKQDMREFSRFISGGAGTEGLETSEVMNRGKRGTVRSLYECGLADEMITWTESPLFMLGFFFVFKLLIGATFVYALPTALLDFMPVYLLALSFSWAAVLCYYLSSMNNVFLVLSFLIWPATIPLAHLVIGDRFSSPSMWVRAPEYAISFFVFLFLLNLVKELVLILCRATFSWCTCAPKKAEARLHDCIRACFLYFLVHQMHMVEAYVVLAGNVSLSFLLAIVDRICNAHTWFLLNSELARTSHDESYMQNNDTFFEMDGEGYGFDLWSTDSDSDVERAEGPSLTSLPACMPAVDSRSSDSEN